MNKVWVKVKRHKTIDPEEMCWDFKTAKQFMDDNSLEYIETGNSKQCDLSHILAQRINWTVET
eukprot:2147811-Ditylum_brightwellii.AAC.1